MRCPQRDVDACAFSGLFTLIEGSQDGTDSVHPGHDVDPCYTHLGRCAFGITGDGHDAASRLHGQIKRDLVSSRSVLAVTGDAADDDALGHIPDDGVKGAGSEVLKNNVNVADKSANAFLLLLDVHRLDVLSTVAREKIGCDALAVKARLKRRAP